MNFEKRDGCRDRPIWLGMHGMQEVSGSTPLSSTMI